MKVSILVSDLSEKGAGRWGGAVRPFLLAQALQRLGIAVEILGFVPHLNPNLTSTETLPIKQIVGDLYPGLLKSAWQLCGQIEGDLVYAYKPKSGSFGLGLLYHWFTGKPLWLDIDDWELSWHGGDRYAYPLFSKRFLRDVFKSDGALKWPDHPFYLQQLERLVPKANVLTTHTRFVQERFGGHYIPNGKDTALFDPQRCDGAALRQHYGWEPYRILMFPGAPRPYKGVEDVLQALDLLEDDRYRLVIVGGSPYDDYDQHLNKRWQRWIIQLEKLPYAKMPETIAAADLVVIPQRDHPSAQAQFPLKLTDAMAMARPILATRVGDIPEILGDTGFLTNPEDPASLAQAIEMIFDNFAEAEQRAEQARLRCQQHYSLEAMAASLATLL
ncbi:MAG: glycosyltransferase family 4 protein [Prochlorotrichaceae cyanobacterium]